MMGIYIKGMEMPMHCWQCKFHDDVDDCVILNQSCSSVYGEIKRLPNCPLIPVPPHGDLIDRDALCNRLLTAWDTADKEKKTLISAVMADVVTPIVVGTPTIIPAEEGE